MDRALPVWRAMRTEVLAGQLLDLLVDRSATTDPARRRRMRCGSTGSRPRPTPSSGRCTSAPRWPVRDPATIAALRAYGADVGIAFQLRDDLLGVYGDPAVTGKPAGDDLVEGKRTLLLATARCAR